MRKDLSRECGKALTMRTYHASRCLVAVSLGLIGLCQCFTSMGESGFAEDKDSLRTLFPTDVPALSWKEFRASGFSSPVAGIVFRTDKAPCCGVPLGGIGTHSLDLDTNGTIGFCNIFRNYPRKPKLFSPFLGISVGGKTCLLTTQSIIDGGAMQGCIEPGTDHYYPKPVSRDIPKQTGVQAAKEIHYFGHYPVADLEYEMDAPVRVGLRAWSPFIPGDAKNSNIPGIIFEVHLRNPSSVEQKGVIGFSFPGPTKDEAGGDQFSRKEIQGVFHGVSVSGPRASYAIGTVGDEKPRFGADLSAQGAAWSQLERGLPQPESNQPGASVSVDFILKPGASHVVRFLLAWHVPVWGEQHYARQYAGRYGDVDAVAADLASRADALLHRVLAWQQAVFTEKGLPVWLRDALVNNLCLIAEDSYWAQSTPPLEWAGGDGAYGMIECPRACPQIECVPCSWYGNIPIVYFFPELALSTLRGYKQYQASNGAAPFVFGPKEEFYAGGHAWENQIALNGVCYVDMVDRLWLRTGDDAVLREFYDSLKKSTTLTALIGEPPASVISMPSGDKQTEWWEGWPWTGMTPHVGGMHLSNMAIAERMARKMGDEAFAQQCREWLQEGQMYLESRLWNENSYLLMWNLNSGKKDDRIMANQLDAEWADSYHGLPGVFRPDRVRTVLDTVRRTCIVDTGAVSFSSRKGEPELATYGIFVPEIIILGMTYMYRGDRELGLDLIRRMMDTVVCKQLMGWDTPNQIRADTGARTFGTDYYQNMMLWALPAALEGKNIAEACQPGGLVRRVLDAARE